ncbi:hypothetical protein GCM10009080_20120 [Cupriavidus pauculus]
MRGLVVTADEATVFFVFDAFSVFLADDLVAVDFVAVDFVAAYATGVANRAALTSADVARAVNSGRPKSRDITESVRNMICSARGAEWR